MTPLDEGLRGSGGVAAAGGVEPPNVSPKALAEAEAMVGFWLRRSCNSVQLEADLIRHYAFALGDEDPLYHDARYAGSTRYGGIVAPPYLPVALPPLHAAGKLAGLQWIYGGCEFSLFEPIRAGDTITTHARLTSVTSKESKNAGTIVVQDSEVLFVNQRGALVARTRPALVRTVRGGQGRKMAYAPRQATWTEEQLEDLVRAQLGFRRRGACARLAETVHIGDRIPTLVKGPVRTVNFAFSGFDAQEGWFGAFQGAHVYQVLRQKRYPADSHYDPVSGLQDTTYRGHWEAFMAKEVGMPGIYDMGHHRVGLVSQAVTAWAGDASWLAEVDVRLTRPLVAGDALYVNGTVVHVQDDGTVVLELKATIQDGQLVATGTATVLLPKSNGASKYAAHADLVGLAA